LVDKRDCVMSRLAKRSIETRPTFVPMHRLPMYRSNKPFPNSDLVGDTGISLPTHASMTQEDAAEVAEALREALR
jgi:perosamine synthetase